MKVLPKMTPLFFALPMPAPSPRAIRSPSRFSTLFLLGALALGAGRARAAALTWDPLNTANGAAVDDGSGDWNTANAWNNGAGNQTWTAGDTATFTGTAGGTVTGNASTNGVTVNGTANYAFTGNISGAGGLTKGTTGADTGTLTLTGANNYTGGTAVNAGMLQIGNGTTNGTVNGTYAVAAGATLKLNYNSGGATPPTWANITGAGTLELATAKSFDFAWNVPSLSAGFTGTLQIDGGRVTGSGAAGQGLGGTTLVVVNNGGQFAMYNGGTVTQNFTIAGTGYGESGFEGALRLGNTTMTGNVALSANATIGAGTGNTGTLSGVISGGASALTIGTANMNGTVVFSGSAGNTYTGLTTLTSNGQLVLSKTGGAKAMGGDITIASTGNYATLVTTQDNQFVSGAVFRVIGANQSRFELKGTTQTLGGIDSTGYTGGFTAIQHSEFGAATPVDGVSTLILDVSGSNAFTFGNTSGTVGMRDYNGGSLQLVKNGTGTQTLVGSAITYAGTTTVNGGTLVLQDATAFASATTVNANAVLTLAGAASINTPAGFSLTLSGATLNKTNTGYDTFNSSNVTVSGTNAVNVTNNGSNNQLFIGGAGGTGLTGSGTLNITNTGTATTGITFRTGMNASHFNGAMNVTGGAVNIGTGAGTVLDNTDLALTGARLTMDNSAFSNGGATNASVKSLSGNTASSVAIGAQTLTLGTNNGTGGNFSGVIGGTGSLTKTGTGSQILSGANTYTGSTTVNGGTLLVDGTHAAGAGNYTVTAAGKLGGSGAITTTGTVSVAGQITGGSFGTLETLDITAASVALSGTYLVDLNYAGQTGNLADGTVADALSVVGNVNLTGMNIQLAGTDAVGPAGTHYRIKLLSWTGSDGGTAVADGANFTNVTGLGLAANQTIVRNGNAYYLVPEPASLALLGLGSLLLLRRPSSRSSRRRPQHTGA